MALMRDKLGLCQWFHYEDERTLTRAVEEMQRLGVRHLRTAVSWADYCREGGRAWHARMLRALAPFEVLLSVWHTPPSIAEEPRCAAPPRRLRDYADFLDHLIDSFAGQFTAIELWNEPNNRLKWDFPRLDPDWRKFGEMVRDAAYWCRHRGVPTVLGGMIPVDHHWLELMRAHGALAHCDVVGIHGFPEMWWPDAPNWDWHRDWHGWTDKVTRIAPVTGGRPVWITETGLATWDLQRCVEDRITLQIEMLDQAALAPAERVYWYTLLDLDPAREAIEGFHVDENEYHLGLIRHDGSYKPAYARFHELMRASIPATITGRASGATALSA